MDGRVGYAAETGTSAGGEGHEYEQVGGGEGGVAVSDPTYMEVGERGGGEGKVSNSRRMKLMQEAMPSSS